MPVSERMWGFKSPLAHDGDIANAPHHPENDDDIELFDRRDARLVLMLTAVLSEYVEQPRVGIA